MLETDDDLDTLIRRKDHLNVLRYLRVHQIRDPALAVEAGTAWLGQDLSGGRGGRNQGLDYLAALEQVCLAALEVSKPELAELCLKRLEQAGVAVPTRTRTPEPPEQPPSSPPSLTAEGEEQTPQALPSNSNSNDTSSSSSNGSTRFRLLMGRCLEAAQDYAGADLVYDELLKENPTNLMALKRKYCIGKAQLAITEANSVDETDGDTNSNQDNSAKRKVTTDAVLESLNKYLQQNPADTAAWYELAQLRLELLGDYKGAAFCLEEVVLAVPADSKIHVELAECLATSVSTASNNMERLETLHRARQHMAQALELDPHNRRAKLGLVSVANSYLIAAAASASKTTSNNKEIAVVDDHDIAVSQELVKYGAEQVLEAYQGSELFSHVQSLMAEYTTDSDHYDVVD